MKPAGLTGLAMDTLEASAAEIKRVFDVFSSSLDIDADNDSSAPVPGSGSGILVHCTQGKDRTGLIILLSLLLTGIIDSEVMASEYVLSEKELENEPAAEKEERMREIRALGLGEEYARCPKNFTERVTGFLREKYGGARGYLEYIGVEERDIESVRRRLLA